MKKSYKYGGMQEDNILYIFCFKNIGMIKDVLLLKVSCQFSMKIDSRNEFV